MIGETAGVPRLPAASELPDATGARERFLVGAFEGKQVHGVAADAAFEPRQGQRFVPVRSLFGLLDEATLYLIGQAMAVVEFETTHRFCGRCGEVTQPSPVERAKHCPRCGLGVYPRIPPAVITLVEHDGKLLLARSARFKAGMFSAVAGFVELGESLEAAAAREVREEVGVEIADLQYFGSQPWPFGRSLMVGYFARYAGGEILVDGQEIVEAGWFELERLPLLPPPISIARKLIDTYVARRASGAGAL